VVSSEGGSCLIREKAQTRPNHSEKISASGKAAGGGRKAARAAAETAQRCDSSAGTAHLRDTCVTVLVGTPVKTST
jgi:hypothetical protein